MLRRMLDAPMLGKRWRGRQKTRWKDSCKSKRYGKCGVKGGGRIGQDKMAEIFKNIPQGSKLTLAPSPEASGNRGG